MAEKVKLSKDGSSIDFVQSDNVPTSVKKFRQSPEIEGFYRFIYENDLQREAYKVLERIVSERKQKKTLEKQVEKVSVNEKQDRLDKGTEIIEKVKIVIEVKSEHKGTEKAALKPTSKGASESKVESKSSTKQQAKAPTPPPASASNKKVAAHPPSQSKGKPAPAKGKAPPPKSAIKKKK